MLSLFLLRTIPHAAAAVTLVRLSGRIRLQCSVANYRVVHPAVSLRPIHYGIVYAVDTVLVVEVEGRGSGVATDAHPVEAKMEKSDLDFLRLAYSSITCTDMMLSAERSEKMERYR